MTTDPTPKSDNLKYALCYIPLLALVFLFIEDNKTDELKKHAKYGIVLFVAYLLFSSIFGFIDGILFVVYVVAAVYFAYKAYNGEKVDIEIIDEIEKKLK